MKHLILRHLGSGKTTLIHAGNVHGAASRLIRRLHGRDAFAQLEQARDVPCALGHEFGTGVRRVGSEADEPGVHERFRIEEPEQASGWDMDCERLAEAVNTLRRSSRVTRDSEGVEFRYVLYSVPGQPRLYTALGCRAGSLRALRRQVAGR
jgi:hypothetical protein